MVLILVYTCADLEGWTGGPDPPPLKNHKNIGFLSNTGPDPLKNHKATKPAFNVGPSSARQRNAICQSWTPLAKLSGSAHDIPYVTVINDVWNSRVRT